MTKGQKMVWAAAFALKWSDDYNSRALYGGTEITPATACDWAWGAVNAMRDARPDVVDGFGEGEVLSMLDEMCNGD